MPMLENSENPISLVLLYFSLGKKYIWNPFMVGQIFSFRNSSVHANELFADYVQQQIIHE